MNNLKMDDVERVMRSRVIAQSLAPAPRREKTRPILRAIDNLLADRELEKKLLELDNYV